MKILMIGGTGTISYDATLFFLEKGHDVYLCNRGNRNTITHSNIHYIIADVSNADSLSNALAEYRFDVIFDFILYNTKMMEERLKIYNQKCKQFFFISSATAYKLTDNVITEDYPLGNDAWYYSKGKKECEDYLRSNIDNYSFDFTIVRPYITYDNRRLPFPVVSKIRYYSLLYRIINDKPIIMCDDGKARVTITSTKDFAVALEGLLLNPKAKNQAFHITGDTVISWNEILTIIQNKLKKKAIVVNIPSNQLAKLFPSERDELLYDKSHSHIFSNAKICEAVPAFKTGYNAVDGIGMTIDNLMSSSTLSTVDEVWNYEIDAIVDKYEKSQGKIVHKATLWSRIMYYLYQKTNWTFVQKVFNRLRYIRGRI